MREAAPGTTRNPAMRHPVMAVIPDLPGQAGMAGICSLLREVGAMAVMVAEEAVGTTEGGMVQSPGSLLEKRRALSLTMRLLR